MQEAQKPALAESTGLELKQINNWVINQRKRHWKPSEDMQFVLMDPTLHQHHHYPHFCRDSNYLGSSITRSMSLLKNMFGGVQETVKSFKWQFPSNLVPVKLYNISKV